MKNRDVHHRTRLWILEGGRHSRIDLSENAPWLEGHLDECESCARWARSIEQAITGLRSVSETPDPTLVRATQHSVRLAAKSLGDIESQRRMIVVSIILAAAWGAALQPFLWRLFGWVGASLDLPDPLWQSAFIAMWLLPGVVASVLLLTRPAIAKGRHR